MSSSTNRTYLRACVRDVANRRLNAGRKQSGRQLTRNLAHFCRKDVETHERDGHADFPRPLAHE
jgi:hypothetical protein